ncbi:CPXCG motif-containing cysteine-rich protein [Flagellimonas myxillae]|uniref:CPXCG motif-containing cysteine-rich protein n=1 Tax=Flagellimonas myxillae TaxID=2942214 RepID=UPI00201E98C6|nr:CPXCG motif-containing cysteine-rich protein [Muricauda myxillae]MCL6267732.1 CPXCG motif-containing cysteine-rich protein [Muricauda myxillae]
MLEHFFQCPYCWEEISFLLDTSVNQQSYVEDCEVCCNPIQAIVTFENGELTRFEINELGQ